MFELRIDEKIRVLYARSKNAVLIIEIVWNHKLEKPIKRVRKSPQQHIPYSAPERVFHIFIPHSVFRILHTHLLSGSAGDEHDAELDGRLRLHRRRALRDDRLLEWATETVIRH